jgi:hypothetical protein
MLLSLSEELVNKVVGLLAYRPKRQDCILYDIESRQASPELFAISQVNHQLRRLTKPSLYAYVHLISFEKLVRFGEAVANDPELAKNVMYVEKS